MQRLPLQFAFIFTLLLHSFCCISYSQSIPERFGRIGSIPNTVYFTNSLPLNEKGGHLQGVQALGPEMNSFVLSGSSDSYAFYLKVTDQKVEKVVEMDQIPFKHAGGFQLADGMMAVGIEDNLAKDKSKVFIYKVQDQQIQDKPSWIIERKGEAMRSTAGSIGIVSQKDRVLVVVGDWDAKHLDFYQIEAKNGYQSPKSPFASIRTADLIRDSWSSPEWYSYQNINLLQDENGTLYLIGLGTDSRNQNVADLFELSLAKGTYMLKKLDSRIFQSSQEVSFRAGAGVFQDAEGNLSVIACSNQVQGKGMIQVWK